MRRIALRALIIALPVCASVAAACASAAPLAAVTGQTVSAARLQALGDGWVKQFVKDKKHRAVLSYPLGDQQILGGTLAITISRMTTVTPSFASVPIEIRVGGQLVRTVYCAYRIVTLLDIPVLQTAKHRGDILVAGDFRTAQLPDDGRPPIDTTSLIGRALNSDKPAGWAVRPEETSMNLIVKAGSPVVLVVHDGPVALAADVTARTSGGLGESVTVYDETARRMLSGVVTAPSRVELTLPEVTN